MNVNDVQVAIAQRKGSSTPELRRPDPGRGNSSGRYGSWNEKIFCTVRIGVNVSPRVKTMGSAAVGVRSRWGSWRGWILGGKLMYGVVRF